MDLPPTPWAPRKPRSAKVAEYRRAAAAGLQLRFNSAWNDISQAPSERDVLSPASRWEVGRITLERYRHQARLDSLNLLQRQNGILRDRRRQREELLAGFRDSLTTGRRPPSDRFAPMREPAPPGGRRPPRGVQRGVQRRLFTA